MAVTAHQCHGKQQPTGANSMRTVDAVTHTAKKPVEAIPIFTPHRCLMGKFSQRPLAGVVEKLERGKGEEKRKSK